MRRLLVLAAFWCGIWTSATAAADKARKDGAYIDLQPRANLDLKESLSARLPGSTLAELPQGEQTLAGVKFKIGPKCIQLGSEQRKEMPEKADIKVDRAVGTLHVLHATQFGAYGDEGHPFHVKDGTLIGEYKVHYADGSMEGIAIVYGEDVRDWWNWDESKKAKRGKVAWTGKNPAASEFDVELRLFLTTWKNPKPDVKVDRIVYTSAMDTAAAPFCIAISAEDKKR